tara:strand:+ start:1332 stop:1889 length:558 start_codon:yes stop_codon:yes gene_type:complete
MLRISEICVSFLLILISLPLVIIICLLIVFDSKGMPIYFSKRVGLKKNIFFMPKFRTMKTNAPQVATDLIDQKKYLTRFGVFLRKYSIDELPQLYSVFCGNMSFVGPRPALFNQYELIKMRNSKGIYALKPGITGWAQINGRDELSDKKKVELDEYYLKNRSILFDLKIILVTFFKVILQKDISH